MTRNLGSDSFAVFDGGMVHVIATSLDGTLAALEAATVFARGLSGAVALLLRRDARVVNLRDRGGEADAEAALRRLADSYVPRPRVLSCVCERATDFVQLFPPPGLVVIGGQARLLWPTAEQRLGRTLARLGCHVAFVHVPRRGRRSPG